MSEELKAKLRRVVEAGWNTGNLDAFDEVRANGKVVEEWEYSDYLGFLMQLGVIPPLG